MLRAGWVAGTATTAMLAPLITLAPDILSVWLGQQVAKQGAAVLAVMTIGGMLGASTNTVQVFLLANARTGWIALLSLAYGILTCGLAAILVPRFGLSAAAVAGSAALLVRPPAIHWMLRTLGESSVPIGRQIHSLYIPVIVGVGVAVAARAVLPQLQTWVALATGYVITAASVGATVIAVGMLTPGASERRADVLRLIMALRGERRR